MNIDISPAQGPTAGPDADILKAIQQAYGHDMSPTNTSSAWQRRGESIAHLGHNTETQLPDGNVRMIAGNPLLMNERLGCIVDSGEPATLEDNAVDIGILGSYGLIGAGFWFPPLAVVGFGGLVFSFFQRRKMHPPPPPTKGPYIC